LKQKREERKMTVRNMTEISAKNIGELKGLLATAKANGQNVAIIKVPVYMMAIDESYQTVDRTDRNLNYLVSRWDERKIGVLTVVPHEDEGLVYIVDGYGRWRASQIVDEEKYKTLDCAVLLNAPEDPTERKRFEAELFANQNRDVAKLKPVDKHGAMQILGDPGALALVELQEKYGFSIGKKKYEGDNATGKRINSIYEELCKGIKNYGKAFADWYFDICKRSGFSIKTHGYAAYTYRMLRDIYVYYPSKRNETAEVLSEYLRPRTPNEFKAEAIVEYPKLDFRSAISLYAEDVVVRELNLKHVREVVDGKVIKIDLS
jgi:hypothetical protein